MIPWILLMITKLVSAGFEIGASNVMLSGSVSFDAANDAWDVSISNIPKYTAIIPQICHATSFNDCPKTTSQTMMDCATLYQELTAPNWVMSANLKFDENHCPVTDVDADMTVGGLLYVTHPPSLRIQNNVTALDLYSSSFSNTSYGLLVRVIFVKVHDVSLLEIHQAQKSVSLRIIDQSGGAFTVRHECHVRGLRAPRMSTLATVIDKFGRRICTWQCALSHVRYPFNTPPPLASEMNHTNKVCVPLPETFTAIRFEFNVYMQVSSSGIPILTQEFFNDINQLADLMQADAEQVFGECTVILTVSDAVFGRMTIQEILLAHTIHKGIFSNYESINLVRPLRRLLSGVVIGGNAWFPIQGVIIVPRTDIHNIPDLHEDVIGATSKSLSAFVFDEALQVHGTDQKVSVKSLHRSLSMSLMQTEETKITSHDVVLYIILGICILIILWKTLLSKPRRRK